MKNEKQISLDVHCDISPDLCHRPIKCCLSDKMLKFLRIFEFAHEFYTEIQYLSCKIVF